MNARILSFSALTCLFALPAAPAALAMDAQVDSIPVPDPRTDASVDESFAHQLLGVRIPEIELGPGYDGAYLVVQQQGNQVAQVRFMLDPQDPWRGQSMMRVYPEQSGRASVSTVKSADASLTLSPVFTVTYSQYYTSEEGASYDPEEPILHFWLYAESEQDYQLAYHGACDMQRCWEVVEDELDIKIKLSGPHI